MEEPPHNLLLEPPHSATIVHSRSGGSEVPVQTDDGLTIDVRRRIGPNDIRVTQLVNGRWLISKDPIDGDDPAWPARTFSSLDGTCPDGPDLAAMLDWVRAQPWSRRRF
jgi:hypothetical protein